MKQVESVPESPCETQPLPTFEKFGPPSSGDHQEPTYFLSRCSVCALTETTQQKTNTPPHKNKSLHTKTKSAETQCLGDATASYVDSHPSTWKKTRTCALWPPIREPSCRCAYFYLGPSIEPRLVRLPYVPTAQQKNKCTTRAACNSGAQVCSFSVYTWFSNRIDDALRSKV